MYREPGRKLVDAPRSPEVPSDFLRTPWAARALLASLVFLPLLAAWLWLLDAGVGRHLFVPEAKVVVSAASIGWLAVLFYLRRRHRAKMDAALATPRTDASSSRVEIEPPPSRETRPSSAR